MHPSYKNIVLDKVHPQPAPPVRDPLLAILSGILLTASFPPGRLSFLAWFALVPLLKSIDNKSASTAFKLGFITGTAHYLTLIYWILEVLGHYGGLNIFESIVPLLLLCFYLGLYPAIFSSLTVILRNSRFDLLFMASLWVCLEYIRSKLLTGFPWCLLGYSQYEHLHIIQIADLFGVYGLSFMIVTVNGLMHHIFFNRRGKSHAILTLNISVTVLLAGATLIYGHYRLSEDQRGKGHQQSVNAVIIQANIDQSVKWDQSYQTQTMQTYQRLTRKSYDFRPQLIVWPETSVPFFFQDNEKFSQCILSLARESGALIAFGSPAYERTEGQTSYYNRAYLLGPGGGYLRYYDKVHLVPFGEYVPLKSFLFFIKRLVPAAGDFKAGDKIVPMKYGHLSVGIIICFEAIFPELSGEYARKGAHVLLNLTNDAWFGMTSAPYQHLSMAVFRAVENRMPMIRAANTGFSAFIDRRGKINTMSSLFNAQVLKASLDISESPLTFYARFRDVFPFSLLILMLIKIFSSVSRQRVTRE